MWVNSHDWIGFYVNKLGLCFRALLKCFINDKDAT